MSQWLVSLGDPSGSSPPMPVTQPPENVPARLSLNTSLSRVGLPKVVAHRIGEE